MSIRGTFLATAVVVIGLFDAASAQDNPSSPEFKALIEPARADCLKGGIGDGSPRGRADCEAWRATKDLGSFDEAWPVFLAEIATQAAEHAGDSNTFLSGRCIADGKTQPTKHDCEASQNNFQRDYWLALQEDIFSQKSLVLCFLAPVPGYAANCDGVVTPNREWFCAWELVILSSGSPNFTDLDVVSYQARCRPIAAEYKIIIQARASDLFSRIYHKPLPVVPF